MPATNFTESQITAVIAYLRSPRNTPARSMNTGDAERGRAIFEGAGACLTCHEARGKGSRVGTDLSSIGATRSAAVLEQLVLAPSGTTSPQNRFIRATTREGIVITGRRLNEDTLTVQLIDSSERLVSLNKADLRDYVVEKASSMPSYREKLTTQELADLVSYLMSLKGSDAP
jgi:putative heme-binding domain-containing protein